MRALVRVARVRRPTQRMEHTKDAIGTDRDRLLIDDRLAPRTAGRLPLRGCSPQRTIPTRSEWRPVPEEVRQVEGALVIEITTELRMIRPVIGARVEIDAQLTTVTISV